MDIMVGRGREGRGEERGGGERDGMSMTCGTGSSKERCSGMAYGMQSIPSHPQMEQQQTIHPSHPSHQQYHVSFGRNLLFSGVMWTDLFAKLY